MTNKKRGFTMAEVLITIAILAIIVMIGFTTYLWWLKNSNFKYNNESAQTYFALVQTNLSSKRSHGTLEELKTKVEKYSSDFPKNCGSISPEQINGFTLSDGSQYEAAYKDIYTGYQLSGGPIYYLKGNDEDYNSYLEKKSNGPVTLLYDLLTEYTMSSDEDLLHGDICVEFDPNEGLVYSVFYRSQNSIQYADNSFELSYNNITLIDRTESCREKYMVGYYGVLELSQSNSTEIARIKINNPSLDNEETLNLTYNVGVGTVGDVDPSIFYYQITLFNGDEGPDKDKKLMTITMNKDNAGSLKTMDDSNVVVCKVEKYGNDGKTIVSTTSMGFPAWVKDSKVIFVLDAIDYSASTDGILTEYAAYANNPSEGSFFAVLKDTASIYRLGIQNVDNIYCNVVALGDGYKSSIKAESNDEARAFETNERTEDGLRAIISYSRHLYNVRFEEAAKQDSDENTYIVSKEVKWSNTTGLYSDGVLYNGLNSYNNAVERMDLAFVSIPELKNGSRITSDAIASNNYGNALTGFKISNSVNKKSGLFAENETTIATGLVIENKGTIENLTMRDCRVLGAEYTGSFVGMNNGVISMLKTEASSMGSDEEDVSAYVIGTEYVGGIFGQTSNNADIIIEDLINGAMVSGQRYVGGIMGMGIADSINITIKDCENYGFVKGRYYETKYVKFIANHIKDIDYIISLLHEIEYNKNIKNIDDILTYIDLTDNTALASDHKSLIAEMKSLRESQTSQNGQEAVNKQDKQIIKRILELEYLKYMDNPDNLLAIEEVEPQYIGGIVGLAAKKNLSGADDTSFLIDGCISIPRQGKSESTLLDTANGYIHGYCVGGIVGLAYNTSITNCQTYKEKDYTEGYVVGKDYVGGIAGMYIGDGIIGKTEGEEYCINQARVFGDSYVGGIVGCNANVTVETPGQAIRVANTLEDYISNNSDWYAKLDAANLKPSDIVNYNLKIQGWENRGVVVSLNNYAGGVTGFNTGIVYDCISNVSNNGISFFSADSKFGDYVGGIAGYNAGIITGSKYNISGNTAEYSVPSEQILKVNAVVTGGNYVGGVVGYNAEGARVEDYQVTGGTIIATGSCVGGYAGFNASKNLFIKGSGEINPIESAASSIEGKYMVGGIIGYNCVLLSEGITVSMQVNNLLANIKGSAVVGGFIGYNEIVSAEADLKTRVTGFINTINETTKYPELISKIDAGLQTIHSESMLVIGNNDAENPLIATNAKIISDICAGGVVGYDQKDSKLKLKNINNASIVSTSEAVYYANNKDEEVDLFESEINNRDDSDASLTDGIYVSYTGGITGYVNENTIIESCKNVNTGDVNAYGTYTGGISEINNGLITDCSIGNSMSGVMFTGGICGVNYGIIEKTNVKEKSRVTGIGGDYIGGIVSENYGEIIVNGSGTFDIETSGDYTGGVAAYNGGNGTITLEGETTVKIDSKGSYVGGLVGKNNGNARITGSEEGVSGSVVGLSVVGGIVGAYNSSEALTELINMCDVSATDGYAAGIACDYQASNIIACQNLGTITSASLDAAGIILVVPNEGTAKDCVNAGSVSAPKGNAGGICINNYGIIEDCVLGRENKTIEISAKKSSGGVAANNEGEIYVKRAEKITICNTADSDVNSIIGGFVGINKATVNDNGKIILDSISGVYKNISVKSYIGNTSFGGIAGKNFGIISSSDNNENAYVFIDRLNGDDITSANIGGAAGDNYGIISGITIMGDYEKKENMMSDNLKGTDTTGFYGGIAGYNSGTVERCSFSGFIIIAGNTVKNCLGGISGINKTGGLIKECSVAYDSATVLRITEMGALGGISGWNEGEIYSCNSYDGAKELDKNNMVSPLSYGASSCIPTEKKLNNVSYRAVLINKMGYTAGAVGYSAVGSVCTGTKDKPMKTGEWYIELQSHINDNSVCGGLAYTKSGADVLYFYNYANVVCSFDSSSLFNTVAAGIVGNSENTEKAGQLIDHCYNYGIIYTCGPNYAGGIFGRTSGYRVQIENSENHGNIYGGEAAGIIVCSYAAIKNDPVSLSIKNCLNTGDISTDIKNSSSSPQNNWCAAGIYAYNGEECPNELVDCVNLGDITNYHSKKVEENYNTQAAGITSAKNSNTNNDNTTKIIRCRNYGDVKNYVFNDNPHTNAYSICFSGKVYDSFDFSIKDLNTDSTVLKMSGTELPSDSHNYIYSVEKANSLEKNLNVIYFEQNNENGYILYSESGKVNGVGGIPSIEKIDDNIYSEDEYNNSVKSKNGLYYLLEKKKIIGGTNPDNTYIQQYYDESLALNDNLPKISGLKATVVGGILKVSWDPLKENYSYAIFIDDNETAFISNTNIWTYKAQDDWYGRPLKIKVCVKLNEKLGPETEGTFTLGYSLPKPNAHLLLGGYTADGSYNPNGFVLVLENYDEYLEFFREHNFTPEQQSMVRIKDGNNNYKMVISLDPQNIHRYTDLNGNEKYYVASTTSEDVLDNVAIHRGYALYAYCTNPSLASETVRTSGTSFEWGRYVTNGNKNGLLDNSIVLWSDIYFSGIYSDGLEINLKVYNNCKSGNTEFDEMYQTEVLCDQVTQSGKLVKNAAVSSALTHLDYSAKPNSPFELTLGNLPENILQTDDGKVTVQGYHAITQRNIAYSGYEVEMGISEDMLLNVIDYKVTNSNGEWGVNAVSYEESTNTYYANPGYVIYMNSDESGNTTYDVKFNIFLKEEEMYNLQVNKKTYIIDSEVSKQKKVESVNQANQVERDLFVQFKPVVSNELLVSDDGYTVNWSTNASLSRVLLYGCVKDKDGKTTDIILLDKADTKEKTYTFVDSTSSWDYDAYICRVMSVGQSLNGILTVLPYYTETEEIEINRRYARLAAPVVNVPMDANSMDYIVSWKKIAEYPKNNDQSNPAIKDFNAYEVSIEDVAEKIAPSYFYTTEDGVLPRGIVLKDMELDTGMIIIPSSLVNNNTILGSAYVAPVGTIIKTGKLINSIYGTDGIISEKTTIGKDSVITAGSMLVAGTIIPAGTKINNAFVVEIGLLEEGALKDNLTITDTIILEDSIRLSAGMKLVSGTVLARFSKLNTVVSGEIDQDYHAGAGTIIPAGSILKEGTEILSNQTLPAGTVLEEGTIIGKGTVLPEGTVLTAGTAIAKDTVLPAGTILPAGTKIPGGTIITGTVSRTGSGNQTVLSAGTRLPEGTIFYNKSYPQYGIQQFAPLVQAITLNEDLVLDKSHYVFYADTYIGSATTLPAGTVIPAGSYTIQGFTGISANSLLNRTVLSSSITYDYNKYLLVNGTFVVPEGGITLGGPARLGNAVQLSDDCVLGGSMKLTGDMELAGEFTVQGGITIAASTVLAQGTFIPKGTTLYSPTKGFGLGYGEYIPANSTVNGKITLGKNTLVSTWKDVFLAGTSINKGNTLHDGSVFPAGTTFNINSGIQTGSTLPEESQIYGNIDLASGLSIPAGSEIVSTTTINAATNVMYSKGTKFDSSATITLNQNAMLSGAFNSTQTGNLYLSTNSVISDATLTIDANMNTAAFQIPEGLSVKIVADINPDSALKISPYSVIKTAEKEMSIVKNVYLPVDTVLPEGTVISAEGDYTLDAGIVLPVDAVIEKKDGKTYNLVTNPYLPAGLTLPKGTKFSNVPTINGEKITSRVLEEDVTLESDYSYSGTVTIPEGGKLVITKNIQLAKNFVLKSGCKLTFTHSYTVNQKFKNGNLSMILPSNSEFKVGNDYFNIEKNSLYTTDTVITYGSASVKGHSGNLKAGYQIVIPKNAELKATVDINLARAKLSVNENGYVKAGTKIEFTGKASVLCGSDVTLSTAGMIIRNMTTITAGERGIYGINDSKLSLLVSDNSSFDKIYVKFGKDIIWGVDYKVGNNTTVPRKVIVGREVTIGSDILLSSYVINASIVLGEDTPSDKIFDSNYILTESITIPLTNYVFAEDMKIYGGTISFSANTELILGGDYTFYKQFTLYADSETKIRGNIILPKDTKLVNSIKLGSDLELSEDMVVSGDMIIKEGSVLSEESEFKIVSTEGIYDYNQKMNEEELEALLALTDGSFKLGDPTKISIPVSMDMYDNCTVNVSVRAISKAETEKYISSYAGNVRTIQITSRLRTPDINNISVVTGDEEKEYIIENDLKNNGIDFTYADSSLSSSEANGRYEVRIFICDKDGNKLAEIQKSVNNSLEMNGNLRNASFNIPETMVNTLGEEIHITDYAGKYIYIALRATSENAISSYWTDEDESKESYAIIKIPVIKKDAPKLTIGTKAIEYSVKRVNDSDEESTIKDRLIKANQKMVSFEYTNKDGYEIQIVRDRSGSEVSQITVDTLSIIKNGDETFSISWQGADDSENAGQESFIVAESNAKLREMGYVQALPYIVEISNYSVGTYKKVYSKLGSWVVVEEIDGKTIIHLILPDNDTSDSSILTIKKDCTNGLTCIAKAKGDNYLDSDGSHLTGEASDMSSISKDITPTIVGELSEEGKKTKLNVTLNGNAGHMRVLLKLTRGDKEYFYSFDSQDSAGTKNVFDISEIEDLEEFMDGDIVQIAYVNYISNSVSEWTDITDKIYWDTIAENEPANIPEETKEQEQSNNEESEEDPKGKEETENTEETTEKNSTEEEKEAKKEETEEETEESSKEEETS